MNSADTVGEDMELRQVLGGRGANDQLLTRLATDVKGVDTLQS